jgi:hypothetical protein
VNARDFALLVALNIVATVAAAVVIARVPALRRIVAGERVF